MLLYLTIGLVCSKRPGTGTRSHCGAHAGGPPAGAAGAAEPAALAPPIVPCVDDPPVTPSPARAPSEKLVLTLSAAFEAARFSGDAAADPGSPRIDLLFWILT